MAQEILARPLPRHRRSMRAMGVLHRFQGDPPIGRGVRGFADDRLGRIAAPPHALTLALSRSREPFIFPCQTSSHPP